MVGDPSAITVSVTARSQEKPMLLILQTGSAAGRTGLDSANPYNPVPEKGMAEEGNFLSESTSSAVGSRRSRAAAFGDNTLDDIVASPGRRRGRAALEAEGVLTSSSATTVRDIGELIRTNPVRICLKR